MNLNLPEFLEIIEGDFAIIEKKFAKESFVSNTKFIFSCYR